MYGGPEPFSEPHSRLVRDIALAAPPRTFINVHSGEWAIYTPWDSKKAIGPGLPVRRSHHDEVQSNGRNVLFILCGDW